MNMCKKVKKTSNFEGVGGVPEASWGVLEASWGLLTAQRRPKRLQDSPRGAQDSPGGAQDSPKGAQDGPKGAQDSPRDAQEAPKRLPRRPRDSPREPPRGLPRPSQSDFGPRPFKITKIIEKTMKTNGFSTFFLIWGLGPYFGAFAMGFHGKPAPPPTGPQTESFFTAPARKKRSKRKNYPSDVTQLQSA